MTGPARLSRLETLGLALVVPLLAALAAVITLSATSDPTNSAGAGNATTSNTIAIQNFHFSPDPVVVTTGTRITVTNRDSTAHTVTAKDGSFDTGDVGGGSSSSITISRPGTYRYFCNVHNYMTGVITAR